MKETNFEVHFFKGDPGKNQYPVMFSIRDTKGYRRCTVGGVNMKQALIALNEQLEHEAKEGE